MASGKKNISSKIWKLFQWPDKKLYDTFISHLLFYNSLLTGPQTFLFAFLLSFLFTANREGLLPITLLFNSSVTSPLAHKNSQSPYDSL